MADVVAGPLDSSVDRLERERNFQQVLNLLDSWVAYATKLHLGLFHEFYMVRFDGRIVASKPGYYFVPEQGAATVVFFADSAKPFKIREEDGRTTLTLGEVSANGSALVFTEDVDDLVAFAMHLKPIA